MAKKPDNKKQALINAFIELLSDRSMEEISVSDIVKRAGVSRQTFYNHFPDKYILLHEIYKSDFDHEVKDAKGTSKTYIDVWYTLLKKRRTFYIHALEVSGPDSLYNFMVQLHHRRAIEIIRQSGVILNEKQKIRLKIYNYGSVSMIRDLLISETPFTGEELDKIFIDAAPKSLQDAWGFYTHADLHIQEELS